MTLTDLLRLAQSGARGFTTGLLGAPVDIANTMLGGVGGPKPVMGGEWIGDKLQSIGLLAPPAEDLPNAAAEFAGGLLNPGGDMALAAKAAAGTKGLLGAHIVFHGSPHTFDKFDMGKIGTGEGAQAYGHGLYFADNPATADAYRYNLARPDWSATKDGARISDDLSRMLDESFMEMANARNVNQITPSDAVSVVGQRLERQRQDALKANDFDWFSKVADMQSELHRVSKSVPLPKGSLYKVDIPDEAIGKMLDWDKPLSEQPQSVRDSPSIAKLIAEDRAYKERYPHSPIGERTGANVITTVPESQLRAEGIPGIRYLDQGSRASGKGTYNTVLFDDSLAKIIGRE